MQGLRVHNSGNRKRRRSCQPTEPPRAGMLDNIQVNPTATRRPQACKAQAVSYLQRKGPVTNAQAKAAVGWRPEGDQPDEMASLRLRKAARAR